MYTKDGSTRKPLLLQNLDLEQQLQSRNLSLKVFKGTRSGWCVFINFLDNYKILSFFSQLVIEFVLIKSEIVFVCSRKLLILVNFSIQIWSIFLVFAVKVTIGCWSMNSCLEVAWRIIFLDVRLIFFLISQTLIAKYTFFILFNL